MIARSTAGFSSDTSADGLVGVESLCTRCQPAAVVAFNADLPVQISYRIRPREYKSLWTVAGTPEKRSGAM